MNHSISRRWLTNPNCGCSHCPYNFWSSYEYLFHFRSEWKSLSYYIIRQVLSIELTIQPRIVDNQLARSSMSLKYMSIWCPYLDPHLTKHHLNIGIWLREVTKLRPHPFHYLVHNQPACAPTANQESKLNLDATWHLQALLFSTLFLSVESLDFFTCFSQQ